MNWKKVTLILTVSCIAGAIIYDLLAVANGGTESSISYLIIGWCKEFPAFSFGLGYLMGHFTFPIRKQP